MKQLKKLLLISLLSLFVITGFLFVFKTQLFSLAGNYLVSVDELKKSEAIFVLGGSSFDRGNEAARLLKEGYGDKIVCLGKNIPFSFKAIGVTYPEAEVTKINIVKNNSVLENHVETLVEGTSTKEEADAILNYCKKNRLKRVIVVSDLFHTRRIRNVFQSLFEGEDIELLIHGTPSSLYNEEEWWLEEQGLVMVNNEYVKLVYYFLKY